MLWISCWSLVTGLWVLVVGYWWLELIGIRLRVEEMKALS
jgi:hypothetical protein